MAYSRKLSSGLTLLSTAPEHAEQLEELQKTVFPTLSYDEMFRAEHYQKHIELFPQGQFVVVDGDRVVGMTTAVRMNIDFDHTDHTFAEIIQGGWMTSHDPTGQWLYGADIGTHPDYRRRGIARALYAARQETVRSLGLAGQVIAGLANGYGTIQHEITPEQYFAQLVSGERTDPTVTAQRKIGFQPCRLLTNYVNDPRCAGYAVLLVLPATHDVSWE